MKIFVNEFLLGLIKGSGYIFATIILPIVVKFIYKKAKTTLIRAKKKGGPRN